MKIKIVVLASSGITFMRGSLKICYFVQNCKFSLLPNLQESILKIVVGI